MNGFLYRKLRNLDNISYIYYILANKEKIIGVDYTLSYFYLDILYFFILIDCDIKVLYNITREIFLLRPPDFHIRPYIAAIEKLESRFLNANYNIDFMQSFRELTKYSNSTDLNKILFFEVLYKKYKSGLVADEYLNDFYEKEIKVEQFNIIENDIDNKYVISIIKKNLGYIKEIKNLLNLDIVEISNLESKL